MKFNKKKEKPGIRFTYSIFFGIFGLLLFLSTVKFRYEIFEYVVEFLDTLEFYQADELFLGIMFLITGIFVDLVLIKYRQNSLVKNQKEKLHIMKITLRTSQDILNNFLNVLSYHYLHTIKNAPSTDAAISSIDTLIQETANKLKALSYLEHIPEKTLNSGLTILDVDEALRIQNKYDDNSKGIKST